MFEKCLAKLCFLLMCSLFISGCAETIKAVEKDTANIISKIKGQPSQQPGVQTVKVKSTLKSADVRQDPSTNKPPVLSLPGGMDVLKVSETIDWVQVRLDMEDGTQMDGWINKDSLVMDEAADSSGQSQATLNNQTQVQTVKVKSKLKEVNVRRDPSTSKPPIATLPGGMEVLKISENSDWVRVRLDLEDGTQMDGWISKKVLD